MDRCVQDSDTDLTGDTLSRIPTSLIEEFLLLPFRALDGTTWRCSEVDETSTCN
jgi:hypothetical protein